MEQGLAKEQVKQAVAAMAHAPAKTVLEQAQNVEAFDNATVLEVQQSFDLDRPLREARDAFEKAYFEFHLTQESGSMTKVAEKTGLERTHLYRKLKQLGVDLSRSKRNS